MPDRRHHVAALVGIACGCFGFAAVPTVWGVVWGGALGVAACLTVFGLLTLTRGLRW